MKIINNHGVVAEVSIKRAQEMIAKGEATLLVQAEVVEENEKVEEKPAKKKTSSTK